MYFLSRDEKYVYEKPYTLRYTPDDGLPQTNIDRTEFRIKFHDLRAERNLVYNNCGFKVANLHSQMTYKDYVDVDKVETIHGPEVAECVKQALKASSAEVLDYVVSSRPRRAILWWPPPNRARRFDEGTQLGPLLQEKPTLFNNQHLGLI